MAEIFCPLCDKLKRRVAELEEIVRQLQAKVGLNSTNSSTPPSANPLDAPQPVVKPKSPRKPGGQPGHPPHLKQLLPAERVNHVEVFLPPTCSRCHADLPSQAGPHDPEPTRFQVIELPPILAVVTEYQGHARVCPACGEITCAAIPQAIRNHSVGPLLTATLSYFAGCHGMSKRGIEEVAEQVFAAPIALGTVANLEQEVSAALAAPHQEALEAVRVADVKHGDETSWKRAGKLCWLWTAATVSVVAFVIHARRNAAGLTALLGEHIQGILCSDRWGPYNRVPAERRQICWAHLKRDFKKVADRGGPSERVGHEGLKIVKKVFAAWRAFQANQITRPQLQQRLDPIANRLCGLLISGSEGDDATVAAFCAKVLKLEPALWTFAKTEGVEPTNNFMERLLRRAVLWRRRSFGCWSESGCRFVERILTVVQTRRLQDKSALEYLHAAILAQRTGQPCPKLLPVG